MRTDEIVDNSTDTLRRMNHDLLMAVASLHIELAEEVSRVRRAIATHSHPKRWWEFWK